RRVAAIQNVAVLSSGVVFGKPGKGFTVTHTANADGTGIGIDGSEVTISGNQVVGAGTLSSSATGILTVVNNAEVVSIDGNEVTGWNTGIGSPSSGKTITKNLVIGNYYGVDARSATL